jgi:hypothetical protein
VLVPTNGLSDSYECLTTKRFENSVFNNKETLPLLQQLFYFLLIAIFAAILFFGNLYLQKFKNKAGRSLSTNIMTTFYVIFFYA